MGGVQPTGRHRYDTLRSFAMSKTKLHAHVEEWPLTVPFRITGRTFSAINVLLVELESDGHVGRGEAAGVYYNNDAPPAMLDQIESLRVALEFGADQKSIQSMLPPGGARNAL